MTNYLLAAIGLIQALGLFIVADLRFRLTRLEGIFMKDRGGRHV